MFSADIKAHALREAPREACGLICRRAGRLVAEPTRNTAPDPVKCFRVDVTPYMRAVREGACVAYYHSHTENDETPSPADKTIAEHVGLPVFIHSTVTDRLACFRPDSYKRRQPIEGRAFLPLVADAVTTAADHFERLGVEPPAIVRRGHCLDVPELERVTEPQPHDLLVMALRGSTHANHVGVFLGEGRFLHHPLEEASRTEAWDGLWRRATVAVLRVFTP